MASSKLPHTLSRRSTCPIATALDVVGDKWTLLLIRDMGLFEKHRNKDFQTGAEAIPSNILAARLKQLVADGLVGKRQYQAHPPRYEYHLTPSGEALLPVVKALALWASEHVESISLPAAVRDRASR